MDAPPPLPLLLGPILLGCFFHWSLFGILGLQAYLYFNWYPKDRTLLRVLVCVLLVLECAETAFASHIAWFYMVSGWGQMHVFMVPLWSFIANVILTGIIALIVQLFFTYRLWVLNCSVPILAVVVLMSVGQCACAILGPIQVLSGKGDRPTQISFTLWLSLSAACDIVIAASMIYCLSRTRSKLLHQPLQTRLILTNMIQFTMKTGLLTAICAIVDLALFVSLNNVNLHDAPFLILGKLYSNTVFATLNARTSFFRPQYTYTEDALFTEQPWSSSTTSRTRDRSRFAGSNDDSITFQTLPVSNAQHSEYPSHCEENNISDPHIATTTGSVVSALSFRTNDALPTSNTHLQPHVSPAS